jgi:signal peptidase I
MEPTILKGDFILANKYIYQLIEPERGDIIVFPFPEDTSKDFIKRVVGVEGDEIEIRNKQVYINQQKLLESYVIKTDPMIIQKDARPRDNLGPLTVPPNSLFVLGDNRDHSYDSRFWGFVDRRQVKGKASLIYWSWSQDDSRIRRERIGVSIDWKSHAVAH